MATETDISNMALGHIKASKRIGNLRTDADVTAVTCRTFYDIDRDETLRDFDWPFATRIATLDLVATAPNNEWGFAYRYPSGCLNFRRIVTNNRIASNANIIPWRIAADDSGLLIYTDAPLAVAEFTFQVINVSIWPADAAKALSYRLAVSIAPALTGSDPYKVAAAAQQMYEAAIRKAQANAANERLFDPPADSDSINARSSS